MVRRGHTDGQEERGREGGRGEFQRGHHSGSNAVRGRGGGLNRGSAGGTSRLAVAERPEAREERTRGIDYEMGDIL